MAQTLSAFLLIFALASGAAGQTYTIDTVAGGGFPHTPIVATAASVQPLSVAVDGAGNVYFSSDNAVFKVDMAGILTRVAGAPGGGPLGDGGPATSARLSLPWGVAIDSAGNLYIADCNDNRIRRVTPSGTISTVAGNGTYGYSGDGGPAINAEFSSPRGVAVDTVGNLYVADFDNYRIRKVAPDGTISPVAGNGTAGYSGDGGPATIASLSGATGVAMDSAGNLYIADYSNYRIRKVAPDGTISTVAGGGSNHPGDGGPATSAWLSNPSGVAVDSAGNLYIADSGGYRVRKVAPDGTISTVDGNGILSYLYPVGVAVDSAGNLYIADSYNNFVEKKASGGAISMVAGNRTHGFSGDGGPAVYALLSYPSGVAVDSAGNLYIADSQNNRIRKVATDGIVSTVAGGGSVWPGDGGPATSARLAGPRGVAVDSAGNLFIADTYDYLVRKVASNGTISTVAVLLGDGGPAITGWCPTGVAVDSAGNLFIVDSCNYRIWKVAPGGTTSAVAGNGTAGYYGDGGPATSAQLAGPQAVAVDSAGNLFIADWGSNRIRKVAPSGTISTVAGYVGGYGYSGDGGPATSAQISNPSGIAVDSAGNLYIADYSNCRVRKVAADGTISTVAGNGTGGYSGDGGPATSAQFKILYGGVAVDTAGRVYVADTYNNAIRVLTPTDLPCTYRVAPSSSQLPASGGNFTVSVQSAASCSWTISGLPAWITLSGSATGSGRATVDLVAATSSGAPRFAQISVADITVIISQASSLLLISAGGVVSAASYTAPVAPGSIAAIFGNFLLAAPVSGSGFPIPTTLGGLSFQFSGAPLVPLFYASLGQVNAQVPWELAGQSQAAITVARSGQTSTAQVVNLATYAPGIFAVNGAGTGQGAILDPANRLVDATNPATVGREVQIYCTGLGPVINQPATGGTSPGVTQLATTPTQPTVTIGGAAATVQFSGLTPGAVGLYQVNALVPQAAAKGGAVPVTISIGGVQSNTVTIAVR